MHSRNRVTTSCALLALATGACAHPVAKVAPEPAATGLANVRVVNAGTNAAVGLAGLYAELGAADVVFFGEQHDDAETHRVELAVLQALGERHSRVVLSLEMFERDVQPLVDHYLQGMISETDFLARSRPWAQYAEFYRALVELARARKWPVVAANVPRPMAATVSRAGLAGLDSFPATHRAWAAAEITCPQDAYRTRFLAEISGHSPPPGDSAAPNAVMPPAMAERFYLAQCVKDETMAESVAAALKLAGEGGVVFHVTGAFHSDYRQGTVERLVRRAPAARVITISAVPLAAGAAVPKATLPPPADFVVFTTRAAGKAPKP